MKYTFLLLFLLINFNIFSEDLYYQVKKGDTLYSIAKIHNTTVTNIKNNNFLNSNNIRIGDKLVIKGSKQDTDKNNSPEVVHIVKKGETLYKISKIYNVPIGKLTVLNNISGSQIYIGQKIYINSPNSEPYVVKRGDSLLKIAKAYNTTVSSIKKENKLTSNVICIGDKLYFNTRPNPSSMDPYNYQWPIKYTGVTSPFGYRFHPIRKVKVLHSGVDLKAGVGVDLFAPADGKIISAGWMGAYGKIIIIKHANGYETRHAHLSKIFVKRGDIVRKGQQIGKTGKTGGVTGPHLHYEIRKNNKPLNPIQFKN